MLTAYFPTRRTAGRLARLWSGRAYSISSQEWFKVEISKPLRIGSKLEVFAEGTPASRTVETPGLRIPHGVAFGSGEHATTSMLLRALVNHEQQLAGKSVLDLGTGSGILALTARLFGAKKIIATDWDGDSIRTARQNEALNFPTGTIRWQRADVRKLRAEGRCHLVLANLFSGILCEAAGPITAAVAVGGELWLSGILHSQKDEVAAAYVNRGLKLQHTKRRGKWILLQLAKEPLTQKQAD